MKEQINTNTNESKDYDRKVDFAKRVGISARCLDNWIRQNRIPYLKIGRVCLIPWREALEHLNNRYRIRAAGETKEVK